MRWRDFAKDALILPLKLPFKVRSKDSLAKWLMDLAWLMGHLQGFIKYRYLLF